MVVAMEGQPSERTKRGPIRAPQSSSPSAGGAGCPLCDGPWGALVSARAGAVQDQEVEDEPADHQLVAVVELAQVDAVAVDEDAVEAAVVEDPDDLALAVDHRVATRDGRVVEADVGRQAAPDPRPALGHRDHAQVAVLVGDVVA